MYTGNPHQDRNNWLNSWKEGRWINPNFPNDPKPYVPLPSERNWNPDFPNEQKPFDNSFLQLLNTSAHGPLSLSGIQSGIQLAELTQDQKNFMGSRYNTPDFGVSKEDLWNKTKDMEEKGFLWWGGQEPTTRPEFNDYYNQLQRGKVGNWAT